MPTPAPPLFRKLLRPQQCGRDRLPRSFNPGKLFSHPAAPPATAPAAVEASAAAGSAKGANIAATALSHQPVADSLAAEFREGTPTIPHL